MPVIPWYSVLRGGYIDLITRQPVTTQYSLASAGPAPVGNPGAYQAQPGIFNPAPRPTSRNIFPITFPSLAFWEKCFKETDTLRWGDSCTLSPPGLLGRRGAAACLGAQHRRGAPRKQRCSRQQQARGCVATSGTRSCAPGAS